MLLTDKEDLINILNQEINWCRNNPSKSNEDSVFKQRFIDGLKQAQFHIEQYYKIQKQLEIEDNEIMEE